jgi:hypothetical protein
LAPTEEKEMKKRFALLGLATLLLLAVMVVPALAAGKGFDEFGYNYQARLFSGPADGVDRVLDGTVWGDSTYANDHLVMKWSKAWDEARFHGGEWTTAAWETNEWNGNVPGGSGETDHVKIVYSGPGGNIWGTFNIIFEQGNYGAGHEWLYHTLPSGFGVR